MSLNLRENSAEISESYLCRNHPIDANPDVCSAIKNGASDIMSGGTRASDTGNHSTSVYFVRCINLIGRPHGGRPYIKHNYRNNSA